MAAIKHTELFDFPSYEAAVKEVQKSTKEFANEASTAIKRIAGEQKVLNDTLSKYADLLRAFNTTQAGANQQLKTYATTVSETKSQLSDLKAIEQGLAQVVDIQKASVAQLKAEYKALTKELERLDPASKTYADDVARINQRMKEVTPGINAYNQALKNAKQSVQVAEGSYNALQAKLTELRNTLRSLPNAFDPVSGKLNRTNKEAVALQAEIGKLDGALKKADAQMGIYARNVGNYSGALGNFAKGFAGAFAATVGIASAFDIAKGIFDVNRQFDALNVSLQVVSGSAEEFARNQEFLIDLADRYGLEIISLGNSFKNFQASLVAVGFSSNETRKIFDQIAKVAANLKLSTDDVNGVFKAFRDIASKGKVQAEELRGQLGDRLPAAFKIAADAMGVTTQQLDKMLKKGRVISEEFLPKFAARLEEVFGKNDRVESLNASVNRLFNTFKLNVQDENATKGLIIGIDALTSSVNGLFIGLGNTILFLKDFKNALTGNFNTDIKEAIDAYYNGLKKQNASFTTSLLEDFEKLNGSGRDKQIRLLNAQRLLVDSAGDKLNQLLAKKGKERNEVAIKQAKIEFDALSIQLAGMSEIYQKFYEKKRRIESGEDDAQSGPTAEEIAAKRVKEQQDLLKKLADLEISENELFAEQKLMSEEDFQLKKLDIITKYTERAIELEKSLGQNADEGKITDLTKQRKDAEIGYTRFLTSEREKRQKEAEKLSKEEDEFIRNSTLQYIEEENNLAEAKRKIAEKNVEDRARLEERLFRFLTRGRQASFREQREHLNKMLEIYKDNADKREEIERMLQALQEQRNRQIVDASIQLGQEVLGALVTIAQNASEAAFDERMKQLERQKERELAAAGNNAAAREAIEKKYDEKVRQEKIRKAKEDKKFALFNIAINTAAGVARQFAQGTPFLIPFVIATGAAQAAVVAAQPIPQFRKGTKNAPKGLAIVGEEGPELIERNGRMFITPGKATFTKLLGGEKIYTAKETERIIERAEKQSVIHRITGSDSSALRAAAEISKVKEIQTREVLAQTIKFNQKEMQHAFEQAVSKIPRDSISFDERGIRRRTIEQNNRITHLNKLG